MKYLKEVVVAKDPPVVQVFDVVEYGRRFYRTLTFSSDAALSLVSRAPSGVSTHCSIGAGGGEGVFVFVKLAVLMAAMNAMMPMLLR